MDATTARRLSNLNTHPDLRDNRTIDEIRDRLAETSPTWRAIQTNPFAVFPRADDLPF